MIRRFKTLQSTWEIDTLAKRFRRAETTCVGAYHRGEWRNYSGEVNPQVGAPVIFMQDDGETFTRTGRVTEILEPK